MSDFNKEISKLLQELESGAITGDQFKTLSQGLVETLGKDEPVPPHDPVRLERVEAAERMLREL